MWDVGYSVMLGIDALQNHYTCSKNSRMFWQGCRWGLLALCVSFCLPFTAYGADGPVRYDLAGCVARALEVSPAVRAAETELRIAEAQAARARAARLLPKFDFTWIVGPSPEARGDALVGDTDLSSFSLFTRTEASLIQPLYTFGKLKAAQDAAAGGVSARDAGLIGSRKNLELQVAEAYYLRLFTEELWRLAEEAREEIQKARKNVDEQLEEDTGEYTYTDLARIDRFVYDVEENANKAEKGRLLAASVLRMLLDVPEGDSIALAEERLRPLKVEILPLVDYIQQADLRPDLRQLRAGIEVREALVRVERSSFFPQIFLGGQFKYSYAPNRDDITSPFARDDFNFLQAGVVVGIRQNLSFGGISARVKKARLEHQKLVYQGTLARKGVKLEVEKIYRTLREAEANVAAASKAVKATRRWFISARDGFNAGLEEASELLDAVKEYGIIRAKYYHNVFEFNRTWAALQKATGNSTVQQGM